MQEITQPLAEAALRAVAAMQEALDAGRWEPNPERDPIPLMETISNTASATPPVTDLAVAQDLSSIALGAMQAEEWTGVSETDVARVQGFAFLTDLARDMAPSPASIALAV